MNFQQPRVQIIDTNGEVVPGAKIYFYETGTSTPLNTYSDLANTIANTNPVVCDSSGRAGPIFLIETKIYKVIVKTSADVTIYTQDPVYPYLLGKGTSTTILDKLSSSPVSFGAIGDGASDESGYVQDAIDAATYTVDLLGLTYRCDSSLILKSNLRITNGTLVFSNCTDLSLISAPGSVDPTSRTINSNVSPGNQSVSVTNPSGYVQSGDYVILRSATTFTANNTGNGEIVRVISLSDVDDTVDVVPAVSGTYTTAATAVLRTMTLKENIVIENVTIKTESTVSNQVGIDFLCVKNFKLNNVKIQGPLANAFKFQTCINGVVSNSSVYGDVSITKAVLVSAGSRYIQCVDSFFESVHSGVLFSETRSTSYVVRDCSVKNCKITGVALFGVSIIDSAEDCICSGNEIIAQSSVNSSERIGVYITGSRAVVRDNIITGFDDYGVRCLPSKSMNDIVSLKNEDYHVWICDNIIRDCRNWAIRINDVSSAGATLNPCIVGNKVTRCGRFVQITMATVSSSLMRIDGNSVIDASNTAIEMSLSGSFYQNLSMKNNAIYTSLAGVLLTIAGNGLAFFSFSGNTISAGADAFTLTKSGSSSPEVRYVSISDNDILTTDGKGFDCEISSANLVRFFSVDSNRIQVTDNAIYLSLLGNSSSYSHINLSNNKITNSSSSTSVTVSSSATSIKEFTFIGNTVLGESATAVSLLRVAGGSVSSNYVRSAVAFSANLCSLIRFDTNEIPVCTTAFSITDSFSMDVSSNSFDSASSHFLTASYSSVSLDKFTVSNNRGSCGGYFINAGELTSGLRKKNNWNVTGNTANGTTPGVFINNASSIRVVNNFFDTGSILVGSLNSSEISKNTCATLILSDQSPLSYSDVVIEGNKLQRLEVLLGESITGNLTVSNIYIRSNLISSSSTSCILVKASVQPATISNVFIHDNIIYSFGTIIPIQLTVTNTGSTISNVSMRHNDLVIRTSVAAAFQFDGLGTLSDIFIVGNTASSNNTTSYLAKSNLSSGAVFNDVVCAGNVMLGGQSTLFSETNGTFRLKGVSSVAADSPSVYLSNT